MAAAIAEAISESGMSVPEAAERCGIPVSTLYRIVKDQTEPKFEQVMKIADGLDLPISRFAARAGRVGLSEDPAVYSPVVAIPVVDQEVSASLRGGVVVEHVYLPAEAVPERDRRSTIAVKVRGNCLAPAIVDGDTVIVNTDLTPESGNPVVANVEGTLHVKRLRVKQSGRWTLQSNEGEMDIEPWQVDGVVVGLYRGMAGRLKLDSGSVL